MSPPEHRSVIPCTRETFCYGPDAVTILVPDLDALRELITRGPRIRQPGEPLFPGDDEPESGMAHHGEVVIMDPDAALREAREAARQVLNAIDRGEPADVPAEVLAEAISGTRSVADGTRFKPAAWEQNTAAR